MFIGIDISKAKFDVCLLNEADEKSFEVFENNTSGFESFFQWMKDKQD